MNCFHWHAHFFLSLNALWYRLNRTLRKKSITFFSYLITRKNNSPKILLLLLIIVFVVSLFFPGFRTLYQKKKIVISPNSRYTPITFHFEYNFRSETKFTLNFGLYMLTHFFAALGAKREFARAYSLAVDLSYHASSVHDVVRCFVFFVYSRLRAANDRISSCITEICWL